MTIVIMIILVIRINALEYEANVLGSIHGSSDIHKGVLHGPPTCYSPVIIVDWGGDMSQLIKIAPST